ncbi:MAG: PEP-CTERM sorting domain-containing protein [Fimbriimonadia bacterium]
MINLRRQRVTRAILTAMAAAALSLSAVADDLTPPWYRGLPDTTFQHWQFYTPSQHPEVFWNPYGEPFISDVSSASVWFPEFEGRRGVWCIAPDTFMEFTIPNVVDYNHEKEYRFQLTYFGAPGDVGPLGDPYDFGYIDMGDGWTHFRADYRFPFCDWTKAYVVAGGRPLYIDQLVVDSWCVPEPGTMAAIAAGLGALALRRRKK